MRSSPGGQGVEIGSVMKGGEEEKENMMEEKEAGGVAAMARKLWMGEEGEGWKEKRMREEKEAMEEGKGYGDIILDQIWEVWNWGKTEEDEEDEGANKEVKEDDGRREGRSGG